MQGRIFINWIACLALLLALLPGGAIPAAAQDTEPPCPDTPEAGPPPRPENRHCQTDDSQWRLPGEAAYPQTTSPAVSIQTVSSPDDFGYYWDDSVAFGWIDAKTLGTNSGLYGGDNSIGPIDIGFPFKFYENTYTQLYFNTKGLISFGQEGTWFSNTPLPNSAIPNNIIAAFWDDLGMYNGNRPDAGIYLYGGGTAPNRYFVVEWYRADEFSGEGASGKGTYDLTFEIILYENGDIVMQYLSLAGNLQSATVGIDDDVGVTGLQYLYNAPGLGNNKAVRFYRPQTPAARVKIWPPNQDRLTHPGAVEAFSLNIRNTGDVGTDTYEISSSSLWTTALYAADGTTPLTDTNANGTLDTGPIAQGSQTTIVVKVTTPGGAVIGDDNTVTLTARSTQNPSKSKIVTLRTAVPAPFAQVYQDDTNGAMSLYLVQPAAQPVAKKATSDAYYGYDMAVAEMLPDGFAYFWRKDRIHNGVKKGEIEYTLLDRYGNPTRAVSKLTDHTTATINTSDYSLAVAVAPNGRIGVVWYRDLLNSSTSKSNYNVYYAILDSAGNVVVSPTNLTNNSLWGGASDTGIPIFARPRIAATTDNRFVLAWERYEKTTSGSVSDIYYAIRDTNGNEVKAITRFTSDTPGEGEGYSSPNLARLSGGRALFVWYRWSDSKTYYAVLDSAGNTVKTQTSTGMQGGGPDAVQLSTGNILIASTGSIRFVVLNSAYNIVAGPTTLNNPGAPSGDVSLSAAADNAGHAILSWMDNARSSIFYALVDSSGAVLTDPMTLLTGQSIDPNIFTSFEGYGNTSYSWTPPSGVDGVVALGSSLFGAAPGNNAVVNVRYANYGTTTAANVTLTATLDTHLTYVSDTSGVSPTVSGNTVTWNLPDLAWLEGQSFILYVQIPSTAAIGSLYPITLNLTSAGPESDGSNNSANANVMAALQLFLPQIYRNAP